MMVIVCGGRDFRDREFVFKTLDRLLLATGPHTVVHGAAVGADTLGALWARSHRWQNKGYPAQWRRYGLRAGVFRNERMLKENCIELVVAFPGGKGTANMVRQAKAAGIRVEEIVCESH